jgi:hypothetical protein
MGCAAGTRPASPPLGEGTPSWSHLALALRSSSAPASGSLDLIAPREYRTYAPGIGLVQQHDLRLVRYGYRK